MMAKTYSYGESLPKAHGCLLRPYRVAVVRSFIDGLTLGQAQRLAHARYLQRCGYGGQAPLGADRAAEAPRPCLVEAALGLGVSDHIPGAVMDAAFAFDALCRFSGDAAVVRWVRWLARRRIAVLLPKPTRWWAPA